MLAGPSVKLPEELGAEGDPLVLLGAWKSRKTKGKLDDGVRAVYLTRTVGLTLQAHSSIKDSWDNENQKLEEELLGTKGDISWLINVKIVMIV